MKRRLFLSAAVAAAGGIAVGAGIRSWHPGWTGSGFSEPAGQLLHAVAKAVLDGLWPVDPQAQSQAQGAHLERLAAVVAALPPATQGELSQLLALLCLAPGRWGLAGLATPWSHADKAEVAAALQRMRVSAVTARVQAYQALRELTMAAHFSAPQSWTSLGYPGPQPL